MTRSSSPTRWWSLSTGSTDLLPSYHNLWLCFVRTFHCSISLILLIGCAVYRWCRRLYSVLWRSPCDTTLPCSSTYTSSMIVLSFLQRTRRKSCCCCRVCEKPLCDEAGASSAVFLLLLGVTKLQITARTFHLLLSRVPMIQVVIFTRPSIGNGSPRWMSTGTRMVSKRNSPCCNAQGITRGERMNTQYRLLRLALTRQGKIMLQLQPQ